MSGEAAPSSSDPGYLTDVEYTGDFHAHLAPAWLAYIATVNGYAAPRLDGEFTWCDLGCGRGVTALALAATHPRGRFHACDLNPAHIAHAERLRREAGLGNAFLLARSFAQMLEEDLPQFDFIVLHGVYGWVPQAAREEIHAFLAARLKPGGLVMVSYNAMPGWAQLLPLRSMFQACAADIPGDSLARARGAWERLKALAEDGAAGFAQSPAALAQLAEMESQDIRYIAHEYLTPHGDAFEFAAVERAMRGCGLAYAGSMNPPDNYPELAVPQRFRALVTEAGTRTLAETRRDFIVGTRFRQDLYAAQPAQRHAPPDLRPGHWAGTEFCLLDLPERLPLRVDEGPLRFDLRDQAEPVRAVHGLLERGPAAAEAIARAAGMSDTQAAFLIQQLVVSGHLGPCPAARAAPGWLPLNTALIDAALGEHRQEVPLAGRHTATAVYAEVVHAAMLESAAQSADAQQAALAVQARLRRHAHPVVLHAANGLQRAAADAEVLEYAASVWRSLRERGNEDARRMHLCGLLD